MRFQTPQFIDVEDKIFGPLTLKQFIYLVGGGGFSFIIYKSLPFFVAVLFIIPVAGLAVALAFYKVNNKPFIFTIEAAFNYLRSKHLYIWKKEEKKPEASDLTKALDPSYVPNIADSKLKDMSWSLGVKDSIYAETEENRFGTHE